MRLRLVAKVRREQSKLDGLLANVCERSRTSSFIERRAVLSPNTLPNELCPKVDLMIATPTLHYTTTDTTFTVIFDVQGSSIPHCNPACLSLMY